jgi:phosphoribosylamine--glycine ligase
MPVKGAVIEGIDEVISEGSVSVVHAGTKRVGQSIVVSGGRVLNIIAEDRDIQAAVDKCYAAAAKIRSVPDLQIRTDVGQSVPEI